MTLIEALQALEKGEKIRHSSHLPKHYLVLDNTKLLVNEKGVLDGIHLHGYSYHSIIADGWEIYKEKEVK